VEPVRALLTCTAALLDQGRVVDRLARLLTAAALIGGVTYPLAFGPPPLWFAGVAIVTASSGLAELYFAVRVAFDAALFHAVANASGEPDFTGLDAALAQLDLLPAQRRGRPVQARITGARRLFRYQIAAFVIQLLCLTIGAALAAVSSD
jgi:hypothetical protein